MVVAKNSSPQMTQRKLPALPRPGFCGAAALVAWLWSPTGASEAAIRLPILSRKVPEGNVLHRCLVRHYLCQVGGECPEPRCLGGNRPHFRVAILQRFGPFAQGFERRGAELGGRFRCVR